MRPGLITIALFAILIISCETTVKQELQGAHSKNLYEKYHVKKMIQFTHDLAFIEPENLGRILQTTTFNKKGEVIKIIRYDKSGNICFTENIDPELEKGKNKLKKKGYEDSLTVTNLNPAGQTIEKISHTYNEQKKIISTIRTDKDGVLVEKMTFEYYPNGLIKKDIYWNVELDKPEQIINYQYEYYK